MSQPGPSRPPRRKAPKPTGKWRTKPREEMTDDDYRSEFREKSGDLQKIVKKGFDTYLSKAGVSASRIEPIRNTLFGDIYVTPPPCVITLRRVVNYLTNTQINELCSIVNIYRQLLNTDPYYAYVDGPQSEYYKYDARTGERFPVSSELNKLPEFRSGMLKAVGSANVTYNIAKKLVNKVIEIANRQLGIDSSDKLVYDSDTDYSD